MRVCKPTAEHAARKTTQVSTMALNSRDYGWLEAESKQTK